MQSAVSNVEDHLRKTGEKLPKRVKSPWACNYRPESDLSPELSPTKATYFQSLIGVQRWIVELGRADIAMETSALASMMASPRDGHLNAVYHMFAFLKIKHNGVMCLTPLSLILIRASSLLKIGPPQLMANARQNYLPMLPSLAVLVLQCVLLLIQTMLETLLLVDQGLDF